MQKTNSQSSGYYKIRITHTNYWYLLAPEIWQETNSQVLSYKDIRKADDECPRVADQYQFNVCLPEVRRLIKDRILYILRLTNVVACPDAW